MPRVAFKPFPVEVVMNTTPSQIIGLVRNAHTNQAIPSGKNWPCLPILKHWVPWIGANDEYVGDFNNFTYVNPHHMDFFGSTQDEGVYTLEALDLTMRSARVSTHNSPHHSVVDLPIRQTCNTSPNYLKARTDFDMHSTNSAAATPNGAAESLNNCHQRDSCKLINTKINTDLIHIEPDLAIKGPSKSQHELPASFWQLTDPSSVVDNNIRAPYTGKFVPLTNMEDSSDEELDEPDIPDGEVGLINMSNNANTERVPSRNTSNNANTHRWASRNTTYNQSSRPPLLPTPGSMHDLGPVGPPQTMYHNAGMSNQDWRFQNVPPYPFQNAPPYPAQRPPPTPLLQVPIHHSQQQPALYNYPPPNLFTSGTETHGYGSMYQGNLYQGTYNHVWPQQDMGHWGQYNQSGFFQPLRQSLPNRYGSQVTNNPSEQVNRYQNLQPPISAYNIPRASGYYPQVNYYQPSAFLASSSSYSGYPQNLKRNNQGSKARTERNINPPPRATNTGLPIRITPQPDVDKAIYNHLLQASKLTHGLSNWKFTPKSIRSSVSMITDNLKPPDYQEPTFQKSVQELKETLESTIKQTLMVHHLTQLDKHRSEINKLKPLQHTDPKSLLDKLEHELKNRYGKKYKTNEMIRFLKESYELLTSPVQPRSSDRTGLAHDNMDIETLETSTHIERGTDEGVRQYHQTHSRTSRPETNEAPGPHSNVITNTGLKRSLAISPETDNLPKSRRTGNNQDDDSSSNDSESESGIEVRSTKIGESIHKHTLVSNSTEVNNEETLAVGNNPIPAIEHQSTLSVHLPDQTTPGVPLPVEASVIILNAITKQPSPLVSKDKNSPNNASNVSPLNAQLNRQVSEVTNTPSKDQEQVGSLLVNDPIVEQNLNTNLDQCIPDTPLVNMPPCQEHATIATSSSTTSKGVFLQHDRLDRESLAFLKPEKDIKTWLVTDSNGKFMVEIPSHWQIEVFPGLRLEHTLDILENLNVEHGVCSIIFLAGINNKSDTVNKPFLANIVKTVGFIQKQRRPTNDKEHGLMVFYVEVIHGNLLASEQTNVQSLNNAMKRLNHISYIRLPANLLDPDSFEDDGIHYTPSTARLVLQHIQTVVGIENFT